MGVGFTGSMGTLVVTTDAPRCSPTAATGCRPRRELAGSGIELVRIATPRAPRTSTGCARTRARRRGRRRRQRARPRRGAPAAREADAVRHRAAQRPRHRRRAPGPIARRCRRRRSTSTARREAPQPRADKLAQVRAAMRDAGATHHLISTVDDVAWLLNLRGADVAYNPVFLAHVLLDAERATLFVGAGKIDADARARARRRRRALAPYDERRRRARRAAGRRAAARRSAARRRSACVEQ